MNVNDIDTISDHGPTRFGLHSVEGFGKTTLAAFFPAPVFIAKRRSFPRDLPFKPRSFPELTSWPQVFDAIESLRADKHDRQTVVIDTADELESLCHTYLCERDTGRKTAPLRQADDAILLDTSDLAIEAAIQRAISLVEARIKS